MKRAGTSRWIAVRVWLTPVLCGLVASLGLFVTQLATAQPASNPPGEEPLMPPGYPSLDTPWSGKAKKAKPAPAPAAQPETPAPATQTQAPPPTQPPPDTAPPPIVAEAAAPAAPKVRKNEVSASGDFFLGQGNVTMPFGFSLAEGFGGSSANITKSVAKPDRTSDYFGGTISYSYGQTWYLDLAYAHGDSSGNAEVLLGNPPALNSAFSIKDDRYQAYVRYVFPGLRKGFSAYLRAGFSYVTADLFDQTTIPALGQYSQTDKTEDLLGNLGFGVGYLLYANRHIRLGVQAEGEGFYGQRTQKSTEALARAGFLFPEATINNDLYGGIGRGTVRFEYRFGGSGAFKLFADGGFQAWFTFVNYPQGLGSFDELLYGPYVKAGVRYSF